MNTLILIIILIGVLTLSLAVSHKLLSRRVDYHMDILNLLHKYIIDDIAPYLKQESDNRELIHKRLIDTSAKFKLMGMYLMEHDPEFRTWIKNNATKYSENNSNENIDADIEKMLNDIQSNNKKNGDNDASR